jgi:sulfur carrier protein
MAKIQLNGKKVEIQRSLSIKDLIKKYRLKENKIAIELNGTILPKDHYKNKKVKNNDKIEIVQFIGGG